MLLAVLTVEPAYGNPPCEVPPSRLSLGAFWCLLCMHVISEPSKGVVAISEVEAPVVSFDGKQMNYSEVVFSV